MCVARATRASGGSEAYALQSQVKPVNDSRGSTQPSHYNIKHIALCPTSNVGHKRLTDFKVQSFRLAPTAHEAFRVTCTLCSFYFSLPTQCHSMSMYVIFCPTELGCAGPAPNWYPRSHMTGCTDWFHKVCNRSSISNPLQRSSWWT